MSDMLQPGSFRAHAEATESEERDEGPSECQYCGEFCDELVHVDDSDPSVGYFAGLDVCRDCLWRAG